MADFKNKRGNWLVKQAGKYWFDGMLVAILILILNYFVFLRDVNKLSEFGIWGLLIVIVALFLFKYLFKLANIFSEKSDNFLSGDDGELDVEEELGKLSDEYKIFSDIKKTDRKDNVDFIVVGPTGIFSLEVKKPSWSVNIDSDGEGLTFDGKKWDNDPLYQAIDNASFVGNFLKKEMNDLSLFVHPVVVFARRGKIQIGFKKIRNVAYVIGKEFLNQLLTKECQVVFSEMQINNVVEKLDTLIEKDKKNKSV